MAVTNGWGKGVNNTIEWGKGKDNATNDWGKIYDTSASGDTLLEVATVPFSNTKSVDFDGVDDFVNCGSSSYLYNTTEFSLSLWAKQTTATSTKCLISDWNYNTSGNFALETATASGGATKLTFYLLESDGTIRITTTQNYVFTQNVWNHIAITFNSGTLYIYVNGISQGLSLPSLPSSLSHNNGTIDIGYFEGLGRYFAGNIDEVAIWTTELSSSDVTAIYNSGTPLSLASYNPISWWRMGDNDTFPTLTDNGSGGNNGTMTNMVAGDIVADVPPTLFSNTKSVDFDGVDDHITTSLNLAKATYPNISLSCWVKMDKANLNTFTSYNPMGVYVQIFPNSSPIRITTDGSKNAFVRVQGNGTSNTTTDLADGSWHNIIQTCEYDAGGTIINVYIDGVKEITNALFLSYAPITGDLFIGSRNASTFFFNGLVDETSVFNSILSQSDVTSIYNSGTPTDLTSLSPLTWYRMGDNDTFPTLTDNGSGGNNGTMTNMVSGDIVTDTP